MIVGQLDLARLRGSCKILCKPIATLALHSRTQV